MTVKRFTTSLKYTLLDKLFNYLFIKFLLIILFQNHLSKFFLCTSFSLRNSLRRMITKFSNASNSSTASIFKSFGLRNKLYKALRISHASIALLS